jgi:tRNA (guanine-N7-)-methyltransferase
MIARRKLYGRRKGQKLSPHQERLLETLLPQLSFDLAPGRDPREYFSASVEDVWLEIGFGAGEHLLWQAEQNPKIGMIGAEPYVSGVAKLLSKLASSPPSVTLARVTPPPHAGEESEGRLSSPACEGPRESGDRGGGNLRLYGDDARNILDALPDASLARVFLLFPDPWPKTRHHKRRFIQTDTLDALARVMKTGAEFRFASDDADYLNWTLERLTAHPAFVWTATDASDWHTRPPDWPQTRYESKALHGAPAFLRFLRK